MVRKACYGSQCRTAATPPRRASAVSHPSHTTRTCAVIEDQLTCFVEQTSSSSARTLSAVPRTVPRGSVSASISNMAFGPERLVRSARRSSHHEADVIADWPGERIGESAMHNPSYRVREIVTSFSPL